MKLLTQNQCRICDKSFCCAKCRARHEQNKHRVEITNLEKIESQCLICNEKPLAFDPDKIPKDLLAHISKKHFPLHCRKCSKMYWTENHLLENWKCLTPNLPCKSESGVAVKINSPLPVQEIINLNLSHPMEVSTQTTPSLSKIDANKLKSIITPNTNSEIHSKILSVNGSLMEHSSIKNVSSFNTPAQLASNLTSNGVKLVRTTSTPMEQPATKPKEQHFDASSHVFSIHASSSESDASPPIENSGSNISAGKQHEKPPRTRGRGKIPVTATPLRQVMSKSIQRAIAEHGTLSLRDKGLQPKKIFDSLSGSFTPPLDLRTSPVLRRTQSEISDRSSLYEEFYTSRTSSRKHVISSTKHIITEDVIISSNSIYEKLETVYETCQNVEASSLQLQSNENIVVKLQPSKVESIAPLTPKPSRENSEKLTLPSSSAINTSSGHSLDEDVFYTPKSVPPKRSFTSPILHRRTDDFCELLKPTKSYPEKTTSPRENKNNQENTKPTNRGRFWSLVSSVMRLASFGSTSHSPEKESNGLVKRCASFAGVINNRVSEDDDAATQQAKRKRTNTVDAHSTVSPDSSYERKIQEGPTKKIKRIQGRKPIERMRNMI